MPIFVRAHCAAPMCTRSHAIIIAGSSSIALHIQSARFLSRAYIELFIRIHGHIGHIQLHTHHIDSMLPTIPARPRRHRPPLLRRRDRPILHLPHLPRRLYRNWRLPINHRARRTPRLVPRARVARVVEEDDRVRVDVAVQLAVGLLVYLLVACARECQWHNRKGEKERGGTDR